MILLGDFNARHTHWGNNKDSTRGVWTYNLMHELQMTCINNKYCAHQPTHQSGTIIDLVFTNSPWLINDMHILYDTPDLISDHYPIELFLTPHTSIPTHNNTVHYRFNDVTEKSIETYKRFITTMLQYAQLDILQLQQSTNPQQIADAWNDILTNTMHLCAEACFGTTRSSYNTQYWWSMNPHLSKMRYDLKHARHMYTHCNEPNKQELHRQFKVNRHKFKKAIRKAKKLAMQHLANRIVSTTNCKQIVWKQYKQSHQHSQHKLNCIPDINNQLPTSHKQSLNNMTDYYQSISSTQPDTSPHQLFNTLMQQQYITIRSNEASAQIHENVDITISDIHNNVKLLYTHSANGPDRLPVLLYKHAPLTLYTNLLRLYNYCLKHSVTPTKWRCANVTAIYKSQGNRNDPSSYRPIAVTNVCSRLFERCIKTHLQSLLSQPVIEQSQQLKQRIISQQHGFRTGYSCADHLFDIIHTIEQSVINTKDYHSFAFLDISKAYDRVDINILLNKLWDIGIQGKLWLWIKSFITNRYIRVIDHNVHADYKLLTAGVPQGCVLSPLLFTIYINDISRYIHPMCDLRLYANDTQLNTRMPGTQHHRYMHDSLQQLTYWTHINKITFSEDKSAVMMITSKTTPYTGPKFKLQSFNLKCVNQYKYLGITLQHNAQWTTHIQQLINKLRSSCYLIYKYITPLSSHQVI